MKLTQSEKSLVSSFIQQLERNGEIVGDFWKYPGNRLDQSIDYHELPKKVRDLFDTLRTASKAVLDLKNSL